MRYTLSQILAFTGIVWTAFLVLTVFFPPAAIFHIINPISIAIGVVLIIVYGDGIRDAWACRDQGISPAHLLTFGVTLNWAGMIIRMARWYVTGQHPSVLFNLDFWFYNLGLWISIWAGLFLISAASPRPYRVTTLLVIFTLVIAALTFTDFTSEHWRAMQEHHLLNGDVPPG